MKNWLIRLFQWMCSHDEGFKIMGFVRKDAVWNVRTGETTGGVSYATAVCQGCGKRQDILIPDELAGSVFS